MEWHETRIRVRYAETDQMGVVYYANHFVWMEIGRVEFCRSRGFSYRQIEEEDGIYMVVVEAYCRYRAPARYDDEVLIRTAVDRLTSRSISFRYELKRATDGELLATGFTRHVFCNTELKPTPLPERYARYFRPATDGGSVVNGPNGGQG